MVPEKGEAAVAQAGGAEGAVPAGRKTSVSVVDRRRVGRTADGSPSASEPNLKPSYVEELEGRVRRAEARLKERIEELEEEARRSRARVEKDLEKRFADREKGLLLDLLGVFDDLERASALASSVPAVAEGLNLVGVRLTRFLESRELRRFAPSAGDDFDPRTMEAVALQPGPEGKVAALLEPGYHWRGELLRPARVAVGRGGEEAPPLDEPGSEGESE